jgi:hypothetical protein
MVGCMAYKIGLVWMIGFIAPYTFTQLGTTGNYSAIAILHPLQFTVSHTLGFSVFTRRMLATGLSQSPCHFKSHVESSFHNLIPFLPFLLTQFSSSAPKLISWQAGVLKLDYSVYAAQLNSSL